MKNNHKLQFLLVFFVLLCLPATSHAQLSEIPWKAVRQILDVSGSNSVEHNDDGFVSKVKLEDIPGGFVMGQLEIFPQLESFEVDSRYYFEDSMMAGVRKLENLKEFVIKNSRYSTTAVLELLAEAPKLEKLEIYQCSEITSLYELTRLRHLKELTINVEDLLTYTPLIECKRLEVVRLKGSEMIDDAALKDLARVTSLKTIVVNSSSITDEGLAALGQLPNLENLDLSRSHNITGDGFAEFQHPESLTDLNLEHMRGLTDEGLLEVKRFENLEHLRLYEFGKVKGKGFECLSALKKLKTLGCPETRIADEHLKLLDGIKSLNKIWLHSCPLVSGRGIDFLTKSINCKSISLNQCRKIDSPDFEVLAKFKNLERLYIANTRIRNDGIEQLCQLKKLKDLNIGGNVWLGDTAMEKLQGCNVENLVADRLPRLTNRSFEFASKMPNLKALSITASRKLTGAGLDQFDGNEKLTKLDVESPKHFSLAAFSHIGKIPNIEELRFSDGQVSVAQLEQLSGMKKLKTMRYDVESGYQQSERLISILKTFPKLE